MRLSGDRYSPRQIGLPAVCWTMAHFLVDMGCALLLTHFYGGRITGARLAEAVLLYDLIAFVLQLPFGFFLDMADRNINGAVCALGCVMVAAADYTAFFAGADVPAAAVTALAVFAGIGNACFHVGAGCDVLRVSGDRASLPGIFVSTGALGLYFGSRAGNWNTVLLLISGAALLLSGAAVFGLWRHRTFRFRPVPVSGELALGSAMLAALLFTLVIVYRSYLGFMMKYSWKSGFVLGLLATLGVMFGKIFGGILGDRAGWGKTMGVSLLLCALLACFSEKFAPCGILTLFLFNMTMPITMTGLAAVMPDFRGTAFGINTTALFAGFLWAEFSKQELGGRKMGLQILLSLAILLLGLFVFRAGRGRRRRRRRA